jgi:DNA repair exonuclease SbcCD ATPase subunit
MREIHLVTILAALIFTVSSCVEKSDKYKALASERDSIQLQADITEANYNETLDILNEVEDGFAQIRKAEGKMMVELKQTEGNQVTRKERMAVQMNQMKELLEQNKARIEQLQSLSGKRNNENSSLNQTILRMQTQMEEKTAFITSLQAEIEKKNTRITELTTSVGQLSVELNQMNELSEKQKQTIESKVNDLNTVWYIVANSADLKTANILSNNGIFRAKTVMDKEFAKEAFVKVDKRNTKVITTDSKRVKILTSHPKESYSLVTADDKTVSVEILDPASFWSVSNYLVIQK